MKKFLLSIFAYTILLGFISFESLGQCMTGFSVTNIKPVSCFDGNDAEIRVSVQGGNAPFTYELYIIDGGGEIPVGYVGGSFNTTVTFGVANGNIPDIQTGIPAYSDYRVRVTSSETTLTGFGCRIRTLSGIIVTQPTVLNPQVNQVLPACNGNDGSIILSNELSFGGTAPYTYSWSNGLPSQKDQNGTLSPGTYSVKIIDNNDCEITLSDLIILPGTDGGTLSPSSSEVCSGTNAGTINLSGHYGAIVRWESSTDNFATVVTDIGNSGSVSVEYNNLSNTIYYRAVVQADGCPIDYSTISTVLVNESPDTPVASSNGPQCVGATLNLSTEAVSGATYAWTGPNGFSSSLQNPDIANVTAAHAGTYSLTVTVEDCPSTPGTTEVVINPIPATPSVSNNGPLCVGGTLNLSTAAVAGATYSWTGPDGFTSSLQNPGISNVTADHAGSFSLTITVDNCPSLAATTNVVISPVPATPEVSNNGPLCVGGTLNLSTDAVAGATYSWTGPNGFTSALQNPEIPNVTAAHAGTYSLTVSFENCSSNAGSTNVVITPIPVATPSNLGPYCEGNPIQLRAVAVAGASYLWTYPNGNTSTERNHNILNSTLADAGTYRLTITINGCTSAEASTEVVVNPRPAAPAPSNNGPICAGETLQLFANVELNRFQR
ncbi:MAG: hypothetical protein M3421_07835 [Bacteroidota bacterium]|nr:hypothetical protein [Bacteroidota bacterium]